MDAAVTALTPTNEAALRAAASPGSATALTGPRAPLTRLQALPPRQKTLLALGTAGLLALAVALVLSSRQVPMTPLFSHTLPESEAGAVIEQLTKLGETFQLGTVGSLIMVPTARANELRMKLATQGLPRSAPSGYELMDKPTFGQSSLQERTQLQRALGGRLEQQIATISAVQSVKVMVALTGQNGFFRDQDKPSASVALTLQPGRTLERSQIAGIAHLTATGVPGLLAKAVTITDQDGNWLTQPDGESRSDLTQQQRAHLRETEARLLKNIKEVLAPALGADNLRATVTAELDFNQIESTSEAYGANKGVDQKASVRSERSADAGPSSSVMPSGVPGAASNQPGTAATAAVVGASAPLQAAQAGANSSGAKRESTVNYEVDKRVEMQRNAVGNIKRINVAVLVNHRSATDAKGKTTSLALPPEEIDKLTALVQEAVGFKKERGDSVHVVNIAFRAEPKIEPEALPFYRQPWLVELIQVAGAPAALTLVALMLLFGVVRPALKKERVEPAPVESKLVAVVDDVQALPLTEDAAQRALEGPRIDQQLTEARLMAMQNPAAVANILRGWIGAAEA